MQQHLGQCFDQQHQIAEQQYAVVTELDEVAVAAMLAGTETVGSRHVGPEDGPVGLVAIAVVVDVLMVPQH